MDDDFKKTDDEFDELLATAHKRDFGEMGEFVWISTDEMIELAGGQFVVECLIDRGRLPPPALCGGLVIGWRSAIH